MGTTNRTVYTSPVGRLVYPNLNTPRQFQGQGKFAYDTNLDVEGEAAAEFEAFIQSYAEEYAKRVGKRSINLESIFKVAKTKEGELIDGVLRVAFKVNCVETKRGTWDRKPAFYREDGSPFAEEPQIGGGTIARIAFTIYEWQAGPSRGMTLQPEGLLIHELVERSGQVDRSFTGLFGQAESAGGVRSSAKVAAQSGHASGHDSHGGADF